MGNEEGYMTIATGQQKYLEMALNLALSIKLKDKKRPIALLHDKNIRIPEEYKKHFDYLIKIKDKDLLKYHMNKLLLLKYSPFEKTMFIDADSLMIKKDINTIWKKLKKYNFTVMGEKLKEGEKCFLDIKKMRDKFRIPYLVDFNAGVMYFDKSNISMKVFKKSREYYDNKKKILGSPFREGLYADEPFISAAMAKYELEPFPYAFRHIIKIRQWWVCAHGKLKEIDIFKENFCLDVGAGHTEHPIIVSFPGLGDKPSLNFSNVYADCSNKLRSFFSMPMMTPSILGIKSI